MSSVDTDDARAIAASAAESGESYYIDAEKGLIVSGKRCSHCGYIKPLSAFHFKTIGKFGRQEWCKRCTRGRSPMSWADEYAEMQEQERQRQENAAQSTRSTRRQGVAHMQSQSATGVVHEGVAPVDVVDEVNEVIAEAVTGKQFALEEGQMEFADWLKIDLPIFSSPLFTVKRSSLGDDGFTLYVNVGIALPGFVPTGDIIGAKTVELAVRVIAGNTTGAPSVYGFAQK